MNKKRHEARTNQIKPNQTKPHHTKPNQTKPNHTKQTNRGCTRSESRDEPPAKCADTLRKNAVHRARVRLSFPRRYLDDISTTSRIHLEDISTTSRRHLDDISKTSRRHLDDISTISRRCLHNGEDANNVEDHAIREIDIAEAFPKLGFPRSAPSLPASELHRRSENPPYDTHVGCPTAPHPYGTQTEIRRKR